MVTRKATITGAAKSNRTALVIRALGARLAMARRLPALPQILKGSIMANQVRKQRHTCGCLTGVGVRTGYRMGWFAQCAEATALFSALIASPDANGLVCAERDALNAHAEATAI